MTKNIFQDIKPISRRDAMPVASTERQEESSTVSSRYSSVAPRQETRHAPRRRLSTQKQLPREFAFSPRSPRESARYGLWYVAIACIVGLFFALSFLFEHATVTIIPKTIPVTFGAEDTFTAFKDSTDADKIVFTSMTLQGSETIQIPSSHSETVSEPATGIVILYNQTNAPYKLVKNTRLQSPDGRIYRLTTAVTIPAAVSSSVPGSVEVAVAADVPGEAGNLTTSDFTLPGLKGLAQATKIYGRTKTEFSGGITGTFYTLTADESAPAIEALHTKLLATLSAKAKVQVPDGYVYFPGAQVFTPDEEAAPVLYSKEQNVPLALSGTLTAYLIKKDTLVRAIAERFVSQYNNEPVTMPNIEQLVLTPEASLAPETDTTMSFTLEGAQKLVWSVDKSSIIDMLVGQKKNTLDTLLADVTSIDTANVVIRPFWKQSFPTDPKRITIEVKNPAE